MLNTPVIYPLFFPSVGPMELAIIVTVILILFGPGKLPEVFRALGDGVRQFKDASRSVTGDTATPTALPKENPPA